MDHHKRWKLREYINALEQLSENGKNDNLPVIVNNEFDDYLYDVDNVKIGDFWNKEQRKVTKFVSIDLYDNNYPIDLNKEVQP